MRRPTDQHRGGWRHNRGGPDLYRDRGVFAKTETRLGGELPDRLDHDGKRIRVFLDFHSTDRNLFSTQDATEPTDPPKFFEAWFANTSPRLTDYPFTNKSRPRKRPDVGKNFVYRRCGIPSATYGVGHETDRAATRCRGIRSGADAAHARNARGSPLMGYNRPPSQDASSHEITHSSSGAIKLSRDQKFFDMYSLVIGVLAAVALAILVLAMKMSELTQGVYTRDVEEYQLAVAERIRPVGQVYLPGEAHDEPAQSVTAAPEPEPVAAALSGPQVYNSACIACHAAGVGGAPIVGDATAWAPRISQGVAVLTQHAIEGYTGSVGYMPAKGGRIDLSDDEIAAAVEYMADESQ